MAIVAETTARKPSQVDKALEALLNRWLSPKELTDLSTRRNPEGIRRDSRAAAYRRGLWWHERRVTPAEGKSYKAVCVTFGPNPPGGSEGVTSYPPARARVLASLLARTAAEIERRRERLRGGKDATALAGGCDRGGICWKALPSPTFAKRAEQLSLMEVVGGDGARHIA